MPRLVKRAAVLSLPVGLCQPSLAFGAGAQAGRRQRPRREAGRRAAVGWEAVPAILARIRPPRFPARDFTIADFGARPGGSLAPARADIPPSRT